MSAEEKLEKLTAWLNTRYRHSTKREKDARTQGDRMYWSSRANALDDVLLKIEEYDKEETT